MRTPQRQHTHTHTANPSSHSRPRHLSAPRPLPCSCVFLTSHLHPISTIYIKDFPARTLHHRAHFHHRRLFRPINTLWLTKNHQNINLKTISDTIYQSPKVDFLPPTQRRGCGNTQSSSHLLHVKKKKNCAKCAPKSFPCVKCKLCALIFLVLRVISMAADALA